MRKPMWFALIFIAFTSVLFLLLWVCGFLFVNDFSVPDASLGSFKNVLIVFPHADDEVMTTGGLIGVLKDQGSKTTLLLLTKGEKGTPGGMHDPILKEVREKEASDSASALGVTTLLITDFGDGELKNRRVEMKAYLKELLEKERFDLVITYDLSGMYGHEDHIAASEVVTDLVKDQKDTKLWYASFPSRVLDSMSLPEHMANDLNFKEKRLSPTVKVFVGTKLLNRLASLKAHKSQSKSFQDSLPVKWLPVWFFHSMPIYEYFYVVE